MTSAKSGKVKISGILSRVVELEPFTVGNEQVWLRLEIFKSPQRRGGWFVRVWRIERYRIQSTFPQKNGRPIHDPSDELVLLRDTDLPIKFRPATSAARAMGDAVRQLNRLFKG